MVVWTVHDACGVEAQPVMLALTHLLKLNLPTSAPNVNCAPKDWPASLSRLSEARYLQFADGPARIIKVRFRCRWDRITSP